MSFRDGEKVIIVHFGELWLRGHNRGSYISRLKSNMLSMLDGESFEFEQVYDRFVLHISEGSDIGAINSRLSHLFGISGYEVAYVAESRLASITKMSGKVLADSGIRKGSTLRISAHRSDKRLKFNSNDIVKGIIKVCNAAGIEPEIKGAEHQLFVNVTRDAAFLYTERIRGLGGLPIGTSGKAVVLLSGGIDSPVAAWYAMKRGLEPIYVHIHGFPSADQALGSKIPRVTGILSSYCNGTSTYYVPSHIFQVSSAKAGKYELILLKSFMLRIAEMVAKKEGAEAIYTGDALGQVASQTTSNLQAEQYGIKMQVLRPLIGMDKQEIINKAREIGTYDESIKPYRDVCSINARNPATKTPLEVMKKLIKATGAVKVASRSLKEAKIIGNNPE
jgi:thiamine biosynthesis protein ThiI